MSELVVGIDLGGTNLRCAVVDRDHAILARHETPTLAHEGPDAVVGRLGEGVRRVIGEAGVEKGGVVAVGIGCPGPLDGRRGVVIKAPNMPGWEDYPVVEKLAAQVDLPVVLENDANAAGWGEYYAGAGRDCRSMVLITLGTGIGGAIILDGNMIHGPDWTAGEIGHVVIVDGGRPAATGNQGALEAYASATATTARFREALNFGWQSALSDKPREEITCADIFTAALEGDNLAKHVVNETGRYLGVMAANLANLLNPERCIFSGGMIRAGGILFDAIRKECDARAFPVPAKRMEIVPAKLGDDAGLIGAAAYARTCQASA